MLPIETGMLIEDCSGAVWMVLEEKFGIPNDKSIVQIFGGYEIGCVKQFSEVFEESDNICILDTLGEVFN